MPENPNQPREGDAVLGGESQPPSNAVVLGGLEGVKRRFASSVEAQRILALKDALNYGESGLDFVILALQDEVGGVKRAAYSLLLTKTETKVSIALQNYNPYQFFECLRTLEGHSSDVNSVAISSDCKTIVSCSDDHHIKVWDIETGRYLSTLHHDHRSYVRSVARLPDGKIIASSSSYSVIFVRNLFGDACLRTFSRHSDVSSVAIAPDGKTIVSGSSDSTIKVWDIVTEECLHTLQEHSRYVTSVAIAPDGKTIVSGSLDNTIKVWDIVTGECLHTLEAPSSDVSSVAIAPDGKTIVSGNYDNTIKVWDIMTGQFLGTLEGHSRRVSSVAISPDGRTIVSGSWDRTIKVWGIR